MQPGAPATAGRQRVLAVDVLRGLVLFFLVPDLTGGFSLHAVAQANPDEVAWQVLARQFRHVDWIGFAAWDLVMPLFVFMVGVSMALSHARRQQDGRSDREQLGHALIRAIALLQLGLLLQIHATTRLEELLPFVVLSIGLPMDKVWDTLVRCGILPRSSHAQTWYAVVVVATVSAWLAINIRQIGHYELGSQILALLGLAYMPAFLLQRAGPRIQYAAIALIVVAYGAAFECYARWVVGGLGPAGAWQQGSNLGAALDAWLLPMLPRADKYMGNPHDYHTLVFVPLVAAITVGATVGRRLAQSGPSREIGLGLCLTGLIGLGLAAGMSGTVAPLLKSLWTPTWSVFSSSVCLLLMGLAVLGFDGRRNPKWAMAFVVLGTNSILLYVLAITQRWRIVRLWDGLLLSDLRSTLSWWPLLEACLVLATLWCASAVLYRTRVWVRI